MRIGELVVDLQSIAKFEDGFLKLPVFQERLAASDVLGFGFFWRGARAHEQRDDGKRNEQRKNVKLSALSIFHYCISP